MLPVKIQCPCGAKYAFDVEPVNGRMPNAVQCPQCGADGTTAGNAAIQRQLEAAGQTNAAASETAPAAPTPPSPGPVRLSVSGLQKTPPPPTPAPEEGVEEYVEELPAETVAPTGRRSTTKKKKKRELAYGEANMQYAAMGAIGTGILCMILWWASVHYTGYSWGIVAWIVGGLVGFGGRMAGGGSSNALGFLCGACALAAILGGQYLAVSSIISTKMTTMMEASYAEDMVHWKDRIHLNTEEEIRKSIADDYTADGDPTTPEEVDQFDIDWFKEQQAKYRPLVQGQVSKEEFYKETGEFVSSGLFTSIVAVFSMGIWGILFVIFGVGTAYKLGSGIIE